MPFWCSLKLLSMAAAARFLWFWTFTRCWPRSWDSVRVSTNRKRSPVGNSVPVMAKLTRRCKKQNNRTVATKITVYRSCVRNTALYFSESWTTYWTASTWGASSAPGHLLEESLAQQGHLGHGCHAKHVCPLHRAMAALARPRPPHAHRPHPKRSTVREAVHMTSSTDRAICLTIPAGMSASMNSFAWCQTVKRAGAPPWRTKKLGGSQKGERERNPPQRTPSCSQQSLCAAAVPRTSTQGSVCSVTAEAAPHPTETSITMVGQWTMIL